MVGQVIEDFKKFEIIHIDGDEVSGILSGINFDISLSAGNYSAETRIASYISNLFSKIDEARMLVDSAIATAKNYQSGIDEVVNPSCSVEGESDFDYVIDSALGVVEEGSIVSSVTYDNETRTQTVTTYDSKGNKVITVFDAEGNKLNEVTYEVNQENEIKHKEYLGGGSGFGGIDSGSSAEKDTFPSLSEKKKTSIDGKLLTESDYLCDNHGTSFKKDDSTNWGEDHVKEATSPSLSEKKMESTKGEEISISSKGKDISNNANSNYQEYGSEKERIEQKKMEQEKFSRMREKEINSKIEQKKMEQKK